MIKIFQKNIIFFILIITFLFNFTYQENIQNISFSNFKEDYLLNQALKVSDTKPYVLNLTKILINAVRNNTQNLRNYLQSMDEAFFKIVFKNIFLNETDSQFLIDILMDFRNSSLIGELIDIINKNKTILDDIDIFIDNIFIDKVTFNDTLEFIKNILNNYSDIIPFLNKLVKEYPDLIYLLRILKKTRNIDNDNNEFENYLDSIKNSFGEALSLLIKFIMKSNEEEILNDFSHFLKNNVEAVNNTLVFMKKHLSKFYYEIKYLFKSDDFANDFIFKIFTEKNIEKILQILIEDENVIMDFANYINKTEKYEYLPVNLIVFCINNNRLVRIFGEIFKSLISSEIKMQETLPLQIYGSFVREIVDIYVNHKKENFTKNISPECLELLNYTYLGNINDKEVAKKFGNFDKKITGYYLYKLIIDTTKDKNDIISYENCLEHVPTFNGVSISNVKYIGNFPTYIISLIDFTQRKDIIKNSTFYENYKYILGFCFPQSNNTEKNKYIFENGTKSYYHCENKHYEYLIRRILEIIQDIEGMNINVIEINKYNNTMKFSWKAFLIFFILIIPIIIYIFLLIYRIFAIKEKKNVIIIKNTRNKEDDDKDNLIDNKIIEEEDKTNKKKVKIVPKWYKLLNIFFNFKENIKELFYFESNKTNINDIRGLNYINGLIGISIILTILGQLYFIFFNIPIKRFGSFQFYELISSPFYVLLIIGLRYSPRVLFSCSGYTLTYKYLSYIERGFSCYFIKFFFYQLYKYFILVLIICFLRYSLYDIISFISEIRPMWKLFYENELKKPENWGEFIAYLLDIDIIDEIKNLFSDEHKEFYHDLLDYFWISFNEIFFFVFGIILLSIGYKAHLRIDYFIFLLIIIIFGFKIGLYFYYYKKLNLYTTLYYYLFDYGYAMIYPLFNLSYFLIGMYFGLINYSLQNGIIDLHIQNNSYKRIINKVEGKKTISSKSSSMNLNENNEINKKSSSKSSNLSLFDNNDLFNNENDNDNDNDIDNDNKEFKKTETEELKEKNENENENENKNENEKYINFNNRDSINDSIDLNSNNSRKSENNNKNNNNYVKELQSMPFLISAVYFIKWNKKENLKMFFNIFLFILFLIIIIFSFSYIIFIKIYEWIIDKKEINEDYSENDKLYEKISLVNFIINPILNIIYLIDIEIVVIFIQLSFFILSMKGHYFINDFFSHIYWSFFTKSYFSFQMVCNPIILFMFYQSETIVKLTLLNIILYFIINTFFIMIFTILLYTVIELPLKKIFKYIIKRDIDNLNLEEQNEEDEDEDEDENDENDDNDNDNDNGNDNDNIKENKEILNNIK